MELENELVSSRRGELIFARKRVTIAKKVCFSRFGVCFRVFLGVCFAFWVYFRVSGVFSRFGGCFRVSGVIFALWCGYLFRA